MQTRQQILKIIEKRGLTIAKWDTIGNFLDDLKYLETGIDAVSDFVVPYPQYAIINRLAVYQDKAQVMELFEGKLNKDDLIIIINAVVEGITDKTQKPDTMDWDVAFQFIESARSNILVEAFRRNISERMKPIPPSLWDID